MDAPASDVFGLVGHRLLDKYLVQSTVALGGFGLVYRASHLTLQKPLALKVLRVPDELKICGSMSVERVLRTQEM